MFLNLVDGKVDGVPSRALPSRVRGSDGKSVRALGQFPDFDTSSYGNDTVSWLYVRCSTYGLRVTLRFAGFQVNNAHLNLECRRSLLLEQWFVYFEISVQILASLEVRVGGRFEFKVIADKTHIVGHVSCPGAR